MAKILVIADDLTGAAEIGGIVLRQGLSVEIVHTLTTPTSKDVRILNTNTRSLKVEEALAHLKELFDGCCHCEEEQPDNLTTENADCVVSRNDAFAERWDWIYLKFDSALRGHIAAEISFYGRAFQKENVVFCPANPSLGRVIVDGSYWVDGKPIAETGFAHDPEFPVVKSDVLEVLGGDDWLLIADVGAMSTKKPPVVVAAVRDREGLQKWASTKMTFGIYAGAAAFFEALLLQRTKALPVTKDLEPQLQAPVLYVCGSNHESSIKRIRGVDADKVVYWASIGGEEEVARNILHKIEQSGRVILAIAPTVSYDAQTVRTCIAEIVGIVQQTCKLQELVIEGGATARAVLEVLDIDTLVPVWEYGPGVIRNHLPEVTMGITLKPGSYPWMEELWVF